MKNATVKNVLVKIKDAITGEALTQVAKNELVDRFVDKVSAVHDSGKRTEAEVATALKKALFSSSDHDPEFVIQALSKLRRKYPDFEELKQITY